jgi:hypothetical protein
MANLVTKVNCAARHIVSFALRSGVMVPGPFMGVVAGIVIDDKIATVRECQGFLAEFDL